jgi:RNA recognition motif-containing protein
MESSTSTPNTIYNSGFTNVSAHLLELLEKTGYSLQQINGQRRYGGPPPKWEGPPPPKECELFIAKIPHDCFEDELVPVFEEVGEIYEFRLMLEFNGYNRGFGFVTYSSPEIAADAVKKLNKYQIRRGRRILVVKSLNNCRLFIRGIPSDKSVSDVIHVSIIVIAENTIQ